MTSFDKRIFEMLIRVLVFGTNFPELFPKDSQAGKMLDQLGEVVEKLKTYNTSQTSRKGDMKVSTVDRNSARATLRRQLDDIARTARALQLSQFWMSRDRSDRAMVEMGHIFAERAVPLRQVFIDSHMSPDFIERLQTAVRNLEKAITEQVSRENERKAATSGIDATRNAAVDLVKRMDPMVANLLRDDPTRLHVWQTARRVERNSRSQRSAQGSEGPPPASPPNSGFNPDNDAPAAHV